MSTTFLWKLQAMNISNISVIGLCITNPFVELSISGINSQRSMIDFHKDNPVSRKQKFNGILPTFILVYLVSLYSFNA